MNPFPLTPHLKDTVLTGASLLLAGSLFTYYMFFMNPHSSCSEFGLIPIFDYFTELPDQTSGPKCVSHSGLTFRLARSEGTRSKVKSKRLLSHFRDLSTGKQ